MVISFDGIPHNPSKNAGSPLTYF